MSKLFNVFFNDEKDHDPRLIVIPDNFIDRLHMCYLILLGKACLIIKPKKEYWLTHPMICPKCSESVNYKGNDNEWKCCKCGTNLSTGTCEVI